MRKKIDPGAASGILESVQYHLNILANTIFQYDGYAWKTEPDYEASALRWQAIN